MRHYSFGRGKWVFIDWLGIEPGYGVAWGGKITDGYCMPEGVRIAIHRPTLDFTPVLSPDPALRHEELGINWANFLHDEGRFRCWYSAMSRYDHPRWRVLVRQCYAESDDGVTWRKPILNLRDFDGSTHNNLIRGPEGHVFIDPSASAGQRYKMVAPGGRAGVLGAVSSDGLAFTQLPQAILPANNSDTDNTCHFNARTRRYALYTRQTDGLVQRRGVNRSESADFTSFPPSEPVIESNPVDPPDWDYYCNGFMVWPGAEDAYIMQLAMYMHHTDVVNVHLALSRDERLWHRPLGLTPWLDADSRHPRYPSLYPCRGVLPTAPGEWSLYFHLNPLSHNELEARFDRCRPSLVRATLREDGFTSLTADAHGQCRTMPFTLGGEDIRVNYRTRYSGYLKCEIIQTTSVGDAGDAVTKGQPVPGFTLADCDALAGDEVNQPLTWNGKLPAALVGQTVRLHFTMFKADIFALKFSSPLIRPRPTKPDLRLGAAWSDVMWAEGPASSARR